MKKALIPAVATASLSAVLTGCQPLSMGLPDPFRLTEPKDFKARRVSSNNPARYISNDDSKRPIPGETTVLADLQGPGIISHIWMTIADNEYGWPRLLRLRIYYDGSKIPSVDCPVGDFFAVGHGFEADVNSLMVRVSSAGRARNCYWPMPFKKSCRVTVTNEGRRRCSMLYYHVDWHQVRKLPNDTLYFHAHYKQMLPAPADGKPYEFLNLKGRGHYVGTVMSVVQAEAGWFGEGDDYWYIDGEKEPSIEGTGSEDYFCDAWGLHVNTGPHYGVTVAQGTGLGSRMTAYRWHLADPVPFTKSLRCEIEHKGWTYDEKGAVKSAFGERVDLMSSVSYWYQEGIAKDLPEVPYGSARLPQGNALQIEVENNLADCKAERGRASMVPDLFWSKDVILFEAEGEGSKIEIPFDVPEDGEYEVYAELAQASDYGIYKVLLDGQPPKSPELEHEPGADVRPQTQFDGYAEETTVGLPYQVGWLQLTKGRHTLDFICLGKNHQSSGYSLGVDCFILAKVGAKAWAAAAKVKEPRLPGGSMADLTKALKAADPVTRGMAALALTDLGKKALPALDALTAALKDPDPNVRSTAANALAAIGPKAAPAVPTLIEVISAPGEQVFVLRSSAAALGAIGKPAAKKALPALKELQKIPRVRWAAETAIQSIE